MLNKLYIELVPQKEVQGRTDLENTVVETRNTFGSGSWHPRAGGQWSRNLFFACESLSLCNDDHEVKLDVQKPIAGRLCDAVGGIMAASR